MITTITIAGPDARPNAILGVHKDYTLRSEPLEARGIDSGSAKTVGQYDDRPPGHGLSEHMGLVLLPMDGKDIGIWYSPWSETAVRMEDDRSCDH
jgi:hypothetical protein